MDIHQLQMLAGFMSTSMFVASNFPMLLKAFRTRDLRSYSLGHIALSNIGNLIYWVYVAGLPLGPIWFLHGFFTVTTALMLLCYVRFRRATAYA
ncbi:MAG TPA: hypothetical protein VJ793_20655 [Anaerolineae bacterium]|nr:hypothetical protein [Anaerolineae bacterium]